MVLNLKKKKVCPAATSCTAPVFSLLGTTQNHQWGPEGWQQCPEEPALLCAREKKGLVCH